MGNLPNNISVYEDTAIGDAIFTVYTSHHGNNKEANVIAKPNAVDPYTIDFLNPVTDFTITQNANPEEGVQNVSILRLLTYYYNVIL